MHRVASAAGLAVGLAVSGCAGSMDSFSTSSDQSFYSTPGYYAVPSGGAPGYYAAPPYYASPYPYQPGYAAPYLYQRPWGGRDGWREREWHERDAREFRNEGHQRFNQQPGIQVPHMSSQPPNMTPAAPARPLAAQPPAARSPADQNRNAIDQLGFRPSR